MKKATKVWLFITAVMVVGVIAFSAVMTKLNWDFTKLTTAEYKTNTYEITEGFNNIAINTNTADIVFAKAKDGKCHIECYEETKAPHSATILDDTLSIKTVNNKSWYDYIGINFSSPKITIYLPNTKYASISIGGSTGDIEIPKGFNFSDTYISLSTGDVNIAATSQLLKIKTSTGDISVKDAVAQELYISASTGSISVSDTNCKGNTNLDISTGKTTLTNLKCENLISNGDTGDIYLNSVIATEKIHIERDTGDVNLCDSDASEIYVETDTGYVKGSLLTDKVFIVESDTGKVDVPKTVTGGKCEITTDTGNIKISVKNTLQ